MGVINAGPRVLGGKSNYGRVTKEIHRQLESVDECFLKSSKGTSVSSAAFRPLDGKRVGMTFHSEHDGSEFIQQSQRQNPAGVKSGFRAAPRGVPETAMEQENLRLA